MYLTTSIEHSYKSITKSTQCEKQNKRLIENSQKNCKNCQQEHQKMLDIIIH